MKKEQNEQELKENEIEEWSRLYPGFTREQIAQIALGKLHGIDFTKYAEQTLTAAEMERRRLAAQDAKKRALAVFECRYFYGSNKYFEPFFHVREVLLDSLLNEKHGITYRDLDRWASGNGQLQSRFTKLCDSILGDRTVLDRFDSEEPALPAAYADLLRGVSIRETDTGAILRFPIRGKADLYQTFGKGYTNEINGVVLDGESEFIVKNKLGPHSDGYYSIAVKTDAFCFAVAAVPNRSPIKSCANLAVAVMDDRALYYDNAEKYIDTAPFVKGVRS